MNKKKYKKPTFTTVNLSMFMLTASAEAQFDNIITDSFDGWWL